MVSMNELHVGHGTTRDAMTIFPIWGEFTSTLSSTADVVVGECTRGAQVGTLQVVNRGAGPALLLEGQVLVGGWQNRMLARSVVVERHARADVDVVCVEEQRWNGDATHRHADRRASLRIRAGLRQDADSQSAVWERVRHYEERHGATRTRSFTDHADRRASQVESLIADLRPLPGQLGVLVALAGQPAVTEVFGNDHLLQRDFDSILRAAALDALDLAPTPTPSRRARRFLERAAVTSVRRTRPAGDGWSVEGVSQYVHISGLDHGGGAVHRVLTNPRHELALAGA
ncbi:hypothetical protein ASF35_11950 [Aeromicrobium sp. Leaf291]|nr:hypothetical protein ASF35_11950 [Aeromicrobium sp. Leaf291]